MLSKLKSTKLQKSEKGFTIIEVMIVLAIAGLILLIVFLAVPALQRSSRNTARKGDVARITAAAAEFVANNNGTLPSTVSPNNDATAAGDALTIVKSAGKLSQYDFTTTPATDGVKFTIVTAAAGATVPASIDNIQIAVSAQCDVGGKAKAGSARQMVTQYLVENSSGTQALCVAN